MPDSPVSLDFSDKFVVVVGGTSGINLGIAQCFAEAGANLGVVSRKPEKVEAACQLLEQHGNSVSGFSADVRDYSAIESGFAEFQKKYGKFEVLISGAAGNFPARAVDMSPNAFTAVMNIDLQGTYHVLRAAYSHLVKPGSSVINISAPQAFLPMKLQAHVCAAKAGVDMLTRTFAMEWGEDGIRVNSIMPGPIENTEGMKRLAPTKELLDSVTNSVPLNRLGTTLDIGRTAMFLASPFASYISGAVIPVDGGWSLGGASNLMDRLADSVNNPSS